jgi:asparagine synthase (glutamine-hydrolysing)
VPGIVGLISKAPKEQALEALAKMVGTLRHEPFYSIGTWTDSDRGIYVGWSARDNLNPKAFPIRNPGSDVQIVFSGEEFTDPDKIKSLIGRDQHESGSMSYLIPWYKNDASFPSELNGRFHGLLIDKNDGTALLFNDRYGMHRLYYHQSLDGFYFGVEAKAILACLPALRDIDYRGVGEFVVCGSVLDNRTLFKDILVLPPASVWKFRNASLTEKRTYFKPEQWEAHENLDPQSAGRNVTRVFSGTLKRYFRDRQSIAMSLTGGLDTRMIMACGHPEPWTLPCYTFGSMLRENQDVRIARQVARICQQSHEVLTADREFLANFAHFAERTVYLTDACVDVDRAPDLFLNQRARTIAPVRITGNYGGEILRGVQTFKPVLPLNGLFATELASFFEQAIATHAETSKGNQVSFAVFKQAPLSQYGVFCLEETQLSSRSPYLDNDFVQAVMQLPAEALLTDALSVDIIATGDPRLLQIRTDRGHLKNAPQPRRLIAHLFLELLFKTEYAFDMGMPQWLAHLNHVVPFTVEKVFLGRHKVFHFRTWYRDTLAPYVQEMLLDERTLSRPYLNRKMVESIVTRHIRGNWNYTSEIHKLLTLELLHRLFVDNTEPTKGRYPTVLPTAHHLVTT